MGTPPDVKVRLTAEDTGVAAAIKELTSQLKNLKKQQDETAGSSFSLSRAMSGIAGVAATIGLARIGKEAFDSAVNIGKMSDKTGLSTQTLSVFHKVAGDVGASTEAVDRGLIRASRSITDFEAGGKRAALAFQILGIRQKDFVGLKPDEKIKLISQRIGEMQAGLQKATATQLIFGRGSGDLTLVMNSLAAQGFDNATAATSKLGLLLDQQSADTFREAKASIQELTDVGQGMATQFEAGMLPAISDVGEGLVDSLTQGGVSFQEIGRYAGEAVRGIALVFLGLGQTLGTVAESIADVFAAAWKFVRNEASTDLAAIGQAAHGHLTQAWTTLAEGARNSTAIVTDEVARQKAMYASLGASMRADVANLFPSADEEERRRKARLARLRPEKQTEGPEASTLAPPSDVAARAAFALLEKQLQDELAIRRAYAKQADQVDKDLYEKGELTLAAYYERRRAAVTADTRAEVDILKQGLEGAQADVQRAAQEKAAALSPADVAKAEAQRLAALGKVDEFQTKIIETQTAGATKAQALDAEEFKAREENQGKILDFEKLVAKTKHDGLAEALKEIEIEKQKLAITLAQSGMSKEEIASRLAAYSQIKTAEATVDADQKKGQAVLKELADERAEVEDQVKNGKLFQVQADEQIRQLELARLPVLKEIAAEMLAQAKASGDETKMAAAEDFQKQVDQVGTNVNTVGQHVAVMREGLQSSLTGGLENFFGSLVHGTQRVSDAFRNLAGSVIGSLAQMMQKMVAQMIIARLMHAAMGGFAGGGSVGAASSAGGGSAAAGFAEGGLIRGFGGPKSDSIPARVSPGEYIVKADAVSQFGLANLEAINRGLKIPSLERLALPKYAEGGLVGPPGGAGDSTINLGIGLDEGLILRHLSSKAAGNIILNHLANNPKAAAKALSRSQ